MVLSRSKRPQGEGEGGQGSPGVFYCSNKSNIKLADVVLASAREWRAEAALLAKSCKISLDVVILLGILPHD